MITTTKRRWQVVIIIWQRTWWSAVISEEKEEKQGNRACIQTQKRYFSHDNNMQSERLIVVFLLLRGSVIDLDNHEKRPKRNSFRWQTDSRKWNGTCALVVCILVSCARSFISSEVTKFEIDVRLMTLHRQTTRIVSLVGFFKKLMDSTMNSQDVDTVESGQRAKVICYYPVFSCQVAWFEEPPTTFLSLAKITIIWKSLKIDH